MNQLNISAMAVAISFAFGTCAMAQTMSRDEYGTHKDNISTESKAAKAGCDSLSSNAKDICVAGVKGKERVAVADLEARYKPTSKNAYDARVTRAEADYAVTMEKCDDQAGNVKDVCVKEAKAAQIAAKADAKAQMTAADANAAANRKSAAARKTADGDSADARKDAAADKRKADYAVAREKCDAFSGDAKDGCMAKAKAQYGKT